MSKGKEELNSNVDQENVVTEDATMRGDSTQPDSTNKPEAEAQQPINKNEESKADRCRDELKEDINKLSNRKRPLNILIVGKPSQGKTSFLCSCTIAALKKWGQYGMVRKYANMSNVTPYLRRFNIMDPQQDDTMKVPTAEENETNANLIKYCPRFFDIAGIPDENNPKTREVFRRILYGGIPLGTSLLRVLQEGSKPGGVEAIRKKYWQRNNELAIDRVVVVMSTIEDYPKELIEALICAAQPKGLQDEHDGFTYKRAVPVFGVITMMDKRDKMNVTELSKSKTREENFVSALGLKDAQHCLGMVTNYFSDKRSQVSRTERTTDPKRDIAILKFLSYVFDPDLPVEHEDDVPIPRQVPFVEYYTKAKIFVTEHFSKFFIAALVLIIAMLLISVIKLIRVDTMRS